MTRRPPRRLVARGRFPLGRICREVPRVTDRSAFLGQEGRVSPGPSTPTPPQRSLQPHSCPTGGGGRQPLLAPAPWPHPHLMRLQHAQTSLVSSSAPFSAVKGAHSPCRFPSARAASPPSQKRDCGCSRDLRHPGLIGRRCPLSAACFPACRLSHETRVGWVCEKALSVAGPVGPGEGVGNLSRRSGLGGGSDLLASSARVRSRSGRVSSQSRMVSFSSPLQWGRGSQTETSPCAWSPGTAKGHSPAGPQPPGLGHSAEPARGLEAHTAHDDVPDILPVLREEEGPVGAGSAHRLLPRRPFRGPTGTALALCGGVLSAGKRGPHQSLSTRKRPRNPERGTGGFHHWPGCTLMPRARRQKGQEHCRQRRPRRRDNYTQSVTLGWIPDRETKEPEATGTTGQAPRHRTPVFLYGAAAKGQKSAVLGETGLAGWGGWGRLGGEG